MKQQDHLLEEIIALLIDDGAINLGIDELNRVLGNCTDATTLIEAARQMVQQGVLTLMVMGRYRR